jgi:hypothetical protein
MAQTKTQAKARTKSSGQRKGSSGQRKSSGRSSQAKSTKSGKSSGSSAAARRTRSTRSRAASQSANGRGTTKSARETAASRAKDVAGGAADVAQKAKTPLLAGGATLAGLAGAVVYAMRSSGRRKVLGVSVGRRNGFTLPGRNGLKGDARKVASAVTDAAKRADRIGQRVSSVANTIQQVSETADHAAKKA